MTANICDSFWVRYDAPIREAHWGLEVKRFVRTLLTTWTDRDNPYDRHQWAMLPLLMGAFQVYLVVLCTMGSRFRWRMGVHLLLLGYWWLNQEPFAGKFLISFVFLGEGGGGLSSKLTLAWVYVCRQTNSHHDQQRRLAR